LAYKILQDLTGLTGAALETNHKRNTGKEIDLFVTLGSQTWKLHKTGILQRYKTYWENGTRKWTSQEVAQIFASQIEKGASNLLKIDLVLQVPKEIKEIVRKHPDTNIEVIPIPPKIAQDFNDIGLTFDHFGHLRDDLVTFSAEIQLQDEDIEITPSPFTP
jgi:hypothetical protein